MISKRNHIRLVVMSGYEDEGPNWRSWSKEGDPAWQRWVEQTIGKPIPPPTKEKASSKPQQVNRKRKEPEQANRREPTEPTKTCQRCGKECSLSTEVNLMIRRYSEGMPFVGALRGEITKEVKETFMNEDEEYTCEGCLYHY